MNISLSPLVRRVALLLLVPCLLTACGGDDSSSSPDVTVTLSPRPLTTTITNSRAVSVQVVAALSSTPNGPVYPTVVADRPVLAPGNITATRQPNGSYFVMVPLATNLAPGNYKGTLTLRLCKDAGCTAEYSLAGNTLPYDITVVPLVGVTVTVNGASVPAGGTESNVHVKQGDVIVITASEPATWKSFFDLTSLVSGVSSGSTSWTATASASSGFFVLDVTSAATPANYSQVLVYID